MQTPSENLAPALALRTSSASVTRQGVLLFELYAHDYYPETQFDPDDALAWFSTVSITWLGNVYRRQILSHSDITRLLTSEFNSVSMTFANNDLYMSQFVIANNVDGMRLVVRYIDRAVSVELADSIVIFTGRLERPSSIDEEECAITARQDLASINYDIPKRTFSPIDPEGRSPADPLYEGFKFQAISGTHLIPTVVVKRHLFFFTKKKIEYVTRQWSSEEGTTRDQVVPLIFGRCNMELIPIIYADLGFKFHALMCAAGHKISFFGDVIIQNPGFIGPAPAQSHAERHLGDLGGTGTNAIVDRYFPNSGWLGSRVAYIGLAILGPDDLTASAPNIGEDALPTMTAIVKGEADLPDENGVFNLKGFTDNNAYLARFILTSSDLIGMDARLIDDGECIATANLCDEPLLDESNAELLLLTASDAQSLQAGLFARYRSTGVLSARLYDHVLNSENPDPYITPIDDPVVLPVQSVDPDDPPPVPDPTPRFLPTTNYFRKRYTFNAPLTDRVSSVKFLTETVLPSFRGFISFGPDGKLRIRTERPADSAFIRSDASSGELFVEVTDILPWLASQQGLVLIGVGLSTSETRQVTGAEYAASGNSIPVAVDYTGVTTLTTSSATLTGGTTTTPPSAVLTVGGDTFASDVISATIDGIEVTYTVGGFDSLESVAAMLAAMINANNQLKSHIRAVWNSNATITVYAKTGRLLFEEQLAENHAALREPPDTAPVAAAANGGILAAGTYGLAYSYQNAVGETFVSPITEVVLSDSQRISVSTITMPPDVDALNWYLSKGPDDPEIAFLIANTGASFFINVLPDSKARPKPVVNSAGEETIRVMASFTAQNIRDGAFRWPLPSRGSGTNQVLIKYREASEDFAERELYVNDYVHQARIQKINKVEIDGSGIDNFHQASRIANTRLAKEREGDFFCEWATDEAGIIFEEGDVICATDVSGDFINLPLRIEELRIQDDGDVRFVGRLYSTVMYSDEAGRHPIALPTSLKYMNQAPPAVTNVTITESEYPLGDNTWVMKIVGSFDFGEFFGGQIARVYLKKEGESDYQPVATVIPNSDNEGHFDVFNVPITTGAGHAVKIVAESRFGHSLGLAAATEYLVTIAGIVPFQVDSVEITKDASNDFLIQFEGNPRAFEEPETYRLEIWPGTSRSNQADIRRVMFVTVGSSHAALLRLKTSTFTGSPGAMKTSHTDKNNASTTAGVTTIETITRTNTRVDFGLHWAGANGEVSLSSGLPAIWLYYGSGNVFPLAGGFGNDPMFGISWAAGTNPGTVKEKFWRGYDQLDENNLLGGTDPLPTLVFERDNVDPGFGTFKIQDTDPADAGYPGPRYSFQLAGSELRIYRNYQAMLAQPPLMIFAAPVGGWQFPIYIVGVTGSGVWIRNVIFGASARLSTIWSNRDQRADFADYTFTADSGTDALTISSHPFDDQDIVTVANTGGAPPSPLVAGTEYHVRDRTTNTLNLAATAGGSAIDLTTNGSGTNKLSIAKKNTIHGRIYQVSRFSNVAQGTPYDFNVTIV